MMDSRLHVAAFTACRTTPALKLKMAGHWYDIKPNRIKSSHNPEEWVFAHYMEFPSQRDDGQWFNVYLFRDVNRLVFGAAVYVGQHLQKLEPRTWAARVIVDKHYREKYITTDESLINMWKRH